ncbi:ammonium transporter [Laccaria bicolor S238N-H82]|uniref:Ammonium transporter n=1 Tax=Laccaria bicolor (strain S238N-H82 / ATCC MYA-4686) TaxID=486041 RepID=B0DU91_LACBS|nr:ammonium transporter [Laccaria bicolor S238N-H82]EDR01907.1 ammonium transporter [Laccaria bicolor S238N-H82]|eukprot:XP_001887517.1 ammonium transporter [Laccaria bicolor S238N-H82]
MDLIRAVSTNSYDRGDLSFIIISGAMVSFMIPGLAFLYSGLSRRKSALSLIWAVSASNAVVVFQWFLWGYSLGFSPTATSGFVGNLRNFGLMKVLGEPSPGTPLLPDILYSFFQMEFACVTAGILVGGVAERGRVMPAMVFIFIWMTLVYCPLVCWVWSANGWAAKWGVLDFAGGGPVEIGSGMGGLAYSWVLGRRQKRELINFRPHNVSLVGLGTSLLWFGWIGFNGGSAFGANLRAIFAVWNSMIAAAFGGIVWCLLDYRINRRWSMVGLCSGTIAGLVAATPSSGYLHPWASVIVGVVSGVLCNFATKLKFLFHVDDALDLFAEHAIGGIIGLLFNSFFASSTIMAMDGVTTAVPDEWVKQLYKQFAYICATSAYTFVFTALIAKTVDAIPGLSLRCTKQDEILGMDEVEIGEFATDYIEIRRDVTDKTFFLEELKKRKSFVVKAEMHELPKLSSKNPTAEQQANYSPHQDDSKSNFSCQNDPNQIQEVDIEKLSHYVVA